MLMVGNLLLLTFHIFFWKHKCASECGRNLIYSTHAFECKFLLSFQKCVLNEDRKRAVADGAKRLYKKEPNLFTAAEKEFRGN